jgi:hypothetical protein
MSGRKWGAQKNDGQKNHARHTLNAGPVLAWLWLSGVVFSLSLSF